MSDSRRKVASSLVLLYGIRISNNSGDTLADVIAMPFVAAYTAV
jgi:hypothetical protein